MASTGTQTLPDNGGGSIDDLNFTRVLQIFLRTWPFIKPLTRHLVYFVVCSALVFLFTTILGFIIIGLVNGGIIAGKPLGLFHAGIYGLDPAVFVDVEELSADARRQLPWLAMGSTIPLLGVVIVTGMLLFQYSIWIFQSINQLMRVRLIDQLQMQSLAYHSQAQTGDAIYRIYQDSAMVTSIIRSIFLDPLMFLGRYLFGLAVVAAFSPWLALILGITIIPALFLGRYFSSRLRVAFRRSRERNSRLTSWIQESMVGIRIIKATGNESQREAAFQRQSKEAFSAAFEARVMLTAMGILAFALVGLTVIATQSIAALYANVEADTYARNLLLGFGFAAWNLGSFTAASTRVNDGVGSLESLITIWGRAQDMAVGLNRVFEILDLEPEIMDAPDATDLESIGDGVAFQNVTFGYDRLRPVLSDINMTSSIGHITAIVGATGTGKSTLMSLLLRLADPQSGIVTVGGRDIRTITLASLRRQISIATQENILFTASVLENIRYAVPEADQESVIKAAKIACADEFIDQLSQGYDTPLGERATKLSTGQRQRIVIARALVKDSPILILDEPTAALDAETELRVMDNLRQWGESRCVFLITHRLSTIRQAHNVMYLRDGRVAAFGPHDQLIQDNTNYRSFVEAETGMSMEIQP
ncbi:MAG: ABC transporter ATP-binding protein [Gammaproteobacteria bacterium]|jgi:ATP-binding cassette subfamily B protein|nr:ABC transporter ATP-binding protein [Gammaproteobacteria bacterium]MDA7755112.1 ABC transporter ATP-binding protein/permease [Pseudomonadales bacterium]MBT3735871.1 ABC transporter ATP-binding protein [Gammaproteobacteria bacterium]MBT3899418.1 ABC transporter ATP-binding protein [Gammaproteobacteria bacterium]MBT7541896.1 ABC transporter ATP-binding protein [Gammaproteobacteria bacterium]